MNYYNEIKKNLLKCEIYDREKDYSKERNRVITYFENGRLLTEAGKQYGENIIGEYANKLMLEVGRKYNKRTLFRMKQFFNMFNDEKVSPLATQLTWSHYTELLPIKNPDELKYYLDITIKQKLTKRALRERIKSKEYERLPIKTKEKLIDNQTLEVIDLVPNPIIIKYDGLKEELTEYDLKQKILNNIDSFLNQLGPNFSYIGNEYRIKMDDTYNYIDRNLRRFNQNKTVGIILCKINNRYIIEYSSDDRVISREYELV